MGMSDRSKEYRCKRYVLILGYSACDGFRSTPKASAAKAVMIDGSGTVLLDQDGQVPLEAINAAISAATGIEAPAQGSTTISFNELNTEVLSR